MNEMRTLLADTARRIFEDRCTPEILSAAQHGQWAQSLWDVLEEAGFTQVSVAETPAEGGERWGDALALLREAGFYAVPLPLSEMFLAASLITQAGGVIPEGLLTLGDPAQSRMTLNRRGQHWFASGTVARVPWARFAAHVMVAVQDADELRWAIIPIADGKLQWDNNLAGEPRDTITLQDVEVPEDRLDVLPSGMDAKTVYRLGAATRIMMIAGALDRVLALSVLHAKERTQFGRPIGRFQAIQQEIAIMAAEVAAAMASADAVLGIEERGNDDTLAVAAAKIRVSQACGAVSAAAHQVHGAMGFTEEYRLHHFTQRLWSWRDEYGNEGFWAKKLGQILISGGADAMWSQISSSL